MDIKKAVNRIYWRFGGNDNKYPFPANEDDIQAYNFIQDYVKETQEQQYRQNELFAKLFTYIYMKILENDKSTVFENDARRKICNVLKKPMFQIIEEFTRSLNESEQYALINELGIEIKHPATRSEEDTRQYTEKLKEAIKTPENKSRLTGEVWEYEVVEECIKAEVNQVINMFK